jgi:hypothetical protein
MLGTGWELVDCPEDWKLAGHDSRAYIVGLIFHSVWEGYIELSA